MNLVRSAGWRLPLVAAGVLTALGGSMHPDADSALSLREELAHMTADPRWVPGHSLVVLGTVMLAFGLWTAWSQRAWPRQAGQALLVAAVALSAYAVETVFHLAAVVDSDNLAHGHDAPVAFAHVGLAVVLYPVSGLAVAWLALTLGRTWGGWRWLVTVPGVLSGLLHAVSVPATLVLPTAELSGVFAGAGVLLAVWALLLGLTARDDTRPAGTTAPVAGREQDVVHAG